mmetsp:Transcript_16329/g.25371  ORF Transcript_16329/g.25371 Transcript_16329/m.25371 type:complete len:99 (+) Transcript_16329:306-602(+)
MMLMPCTPLLYFIFLSTLTPKKKEKGKKGEEKEEEEKEESEIEKGNVTDALLNAGIWMEKAASLNHPSASYNYGVMVQEGMIVGARGREGERDGKEEN